MALILLANKERSSNNSLFYRVTSENLYSIHYTLSSNTLNLTVLPFLNLLADLPILSSYLPKEYLSINFNVATTPLLSKSLFFKPFMNILNNDGDL